MPRFSLLALCSLILGATLLAPAAQATNVTVGADLSQGYSPTLCGEPCTFVNTAVSGLNSHAVSPVDGLIVAWSLDQNTTGAEYRLRVMTPLVGGKYDITGSSSVERPTVAYSATFATALPIKAGQTIGLDLSKSASIGIKTPLLGAASVGWHPVPGEGLTPTPSSSASEVQYAFNAEVHPAPTIASITPTTALPAGGTPVAISGADLAGATAVRFGTVPAAGFTVNSDSSITATAPPGAPGSVPVSVTTVAGTGTSSQVFTYAAPPALPLPPAAVCRVPDLKGKKLKPSKRRSRAADCRIGTVKKEDGVTAKSGAVVKQHPKPGRVLSAGTKVDVTLG